MITVCKDPEIVRVFISLPEIIRYAAEEGATINDIQAETTSRNGWLIYSKDGESMGLTQMQIKTGCMAEFHPYILRKYKQHYDDMIKEIFAWFIEHVPGQIVKLNAWIPAIYKGALNAADRAGMITEGVDRKSFLTKSGACDRILKGITRQELIK